MIDKRLLLDNVGTRGCKVKAGGKKEEEKEKEKWGVLTRDTPHRAETNEEIHVHFVIARLCTRKRGKISDISCARRSVNVSFSFATEFYRG